MSRALSSREISELLGITVRAVNKRAREENWLFRQRPGRGGGKEWLIEPPMPQKIRLAIAAASTRSLAVQTESRPVFTVNTLGQEPDSKRSEAAARAVVLDLAREFRATSGAARTVAYEVFSHQYNIGKIPVAGWVRNKLRHISRTSLCTWEDAIAKNGMVALVSRRGLHRRGSGKIDRNYALRESIIAQIVQNMDTSAAEVMRELKARFTKAELPSKRGLQRWMKDYREENRQALASILNPDGWRSAFMAAGGSASADVERINQRWELDSSPADILLGGKRYTLLGCLDVATRRVMLHLAKTSTALGVCALLRRAILAWGLPEELKMDNGAEYTSEQVMATAHDLGIAVRYCTPFSPHEKPHIERVFRTFQHSFVTRLPGYIGHSVADRKAIESRRSFAERLSRRTGRPDHLEVSLSPEEFQEYCDGWSENIYGEEVHSSLGMSPNEAAARAEGTVLRVEDARALDMLLLPLAKARKVGKKGVRTNNGLYNSPLLGGLEGTEVMVRLDEHDAGYVYLFDLDGIFICRAEDPALTGVSQRDLAMARKARQRAVVQNAAREAKRLARAHDKHETAALILNHAAGEAAILREERAARLAPREERGYSTQALRQAARAAASQEPTLPAPRTEEDLRAREEFNARHALPSVHENTLQELSGKEAFWMALKLEEKIARGETLTPEHIRWLHGYQSTAFYHSWRRQYDIHGDGLFARVAAIAL